MKRYSIAAGIFFATCMCTVLLVFATQSPARITKAAFDHVEEGMTTEEVAQRIGMQPTQTLRVVIVRDGVMSHAQLQRWCNDDGSCADIWFHDSAGTVLLKEWQDATETIGERLRRWVKWPW